MATTRPLSRSLSRPLSGLGLDTDGLSLDLQFAADKTLTARKGPTPVFTRSSGDNRGTTYFGPSSINVVYSYFGDFDVDVVQIPAAANINGRLVWQNGETQFYYTGSAWALAHDGNLISTSAPTSAFRPDGAVWSGTAAVVTATGEFGIVKAANNEPRFDHDPVTLACKGLLIEESRTNLLARSAEIGNAYWTSSNLSISSDDQTSPDGGLNAETITVSAGTPSIYRAVTCTASTVYTLSFYIKIGTLTPSDFKFAVRDDTNGVFIAENITPNVTPVTTEWRRVTYTFTTPVGCVTVRPYLVRYSYLAAGTFFLWGAQLEAGSFPTSYIPTTTSALARSADVCSITGGNFTNLWNQLEGTLLSQTQKASTSTNAFVISASDGSFNNETDLRYNSVSQVAALINVSNASQVAGFQANITSGAAVKSSIAYKLNDYAYAANGASPILDTSALIPTLDRLTIGNVAVAGNNFYLNGHIASFRYFKKRLPNAKLQTITT